MRIKVIACETLFREVHLAVAYSPNVCDVKFIPRECHDDLTMMRRMLEQELAATNRTCLRMEEGVCCPVCGLRQHDAVVLVMGLCGNTVLGLQAPDVPLVLPKVHDCSGLLLGSNERYLEEERRTVFYHQGAVEHLGAGLVDAVPKQCGLGRTLAEYIETYGEENGRYIHEMEHHYVEHNERALVLQHPGSPAGDAAREDVVAYVASNRFGWKVESLPVNMTKFHALLAGDWNEADFLVVKPGERVELKVLQGGTFA